MFGEVRKGLGIITDIEVCLSFLSLFPLSWGPGVCFTVSDPGILDGSELFDFFSRIRPDHSELISL